MKLIRAQMYRITLLIFLAIFNIGQSHADIPQNQTEFLHPDEAFQITYNIVDEEHITINWKIHPGYYLHQRNKDHRIPLVPHIPTRLR